MNNIILAIFLLASTICSCSSKEDINQITIKGEFPDSVNKISISENDNGFHRVKESISKTVTGIFEFKLNVEQPTFYNFSTNDRLYSFSVFARPGDNLNIIFKDDEIVFEGEGKEVNTSLMKYNKAIRGLYKKHKIDYRDTEGYQKINKLILADKLSILDQQQISDKGLYNTLKIRAEVSYYSSLLRLQEMYKLVVKKDLILADSYFEFLKDIKLDYKSLNNLGNAVDFLRDYFSALETYGYLKTDLKNYLLKRALMIDDASLREKYVLFTIFVENYSYNQRVTGLIESVKEFITSEKGLIKLAKEEAKFNKYDKQFPYLRKGMPALNFTCMDQNNQAVSLTDFEDKVVVVDVWSTGCKPCVAEIPFLEKLEHKYENKDVIFLSVSLDLKEKIWRDYMKKRNMKGIQLLAKEGFKSSIVKSYAIGGIPRFMVFDKQGNIYSTHAYRPSDPKLSLQIDEALDID